MILTKTDSIALIRKRLDAVATSSKALDDAYAREAGIKAELDKLRQVEVEIIAKDESKPDALVQHRPKIDLATGKLDRAHKAVLIAEETVILDTQKASVLVREFKMAAVSAYFDRIQERTAEFFDKQDREMIKMLAGRSETAKQLVNTDEVLVFPHNLASRVHDLVEAKRIAPAFAAIEEASKDLTFTVELPHSWVD